MKNFFTKAIVAAGVMASAMVLSSVCAFAGITETKTYDFSSYEQSTADPDTTTYEGLTITGKPNKVSSKGTGIMLNKNDTTDTIQFTVDKKFSLDITSNHDNKTKGTKITSNVDYTYTNSGNKTDLSLSNLSAGTYTIQSDGANHAYVTSLTITVAASETANYTVSAKDALTGNDISGFSIVSGSTTVNKNTDGTYTLDKSVDYSLTATGYPTTELSFPAEGTDISVEIIPTTATAKVLNLSNIGIESTITTSSAHNTSTGFLIGPSVMNNGDKFIRVNNAGYIQFKLTGNGLIEFKGIYSSGSDERTLTLTGDNDSSYSYTTGKTSLDASQRLTAGIYTIGTPNGSMQFESLTVYGTFEILPETTVKVVKTTDSTASVKGAAPAVVKVNDDFFAVGLVDDPSKFSAIKVGDQETTEVFAKGKFGTVEYDAIKFGGKSGQYLYAVAIDTSDVTGTKTDAEMAAAIQAQAVVKATALDA